MKPTLRQVHTAGEQVYVDFAGHTMEVIDGATGEIRRAEIFVAVLGASSYTYAEAAWSQSLPDWIAVHVGMLGFLGGVPRQLVSDNLRAGITRACFYEPLVNRTYADMAAHYGAVVIPARPYKPRDKAKVEVGVQVVQRWILARLRNRRFFSLAELNQAIRELVGQLNDRPMRGWGTTRRALFEQLDRPALHPLPPAEVRIGKSALAGAQNVIERESSELCDAEPGELCDPILGIAAVCGGSRRRHPNSGFERSLGQQLRTSLGLKPQAQLALFRDRRARRAARNYDHVGGLRPTGQDKPC